MRITFKASKMDDEFKLCWKNFQDNIASGFQNLYDRGDLVDVTLACDGKLLHAHKIVLAICSPYFQEIFATNPCKHPIIILKDVTFNIMCELLEFMYQGVVNVKHTELQSFMKIGQLLQIKGLATNSTSSAASTTSEKSTSQTNNPEETNNNCNNASSNNNNNNRSNNTESNVSNTENSNSGKSSTPNNLTAHRPHSPATPSPSPITFASPLTQPNYKNSNDTPLHHSYHGTGSSNSIKRHIDFNSDALSIYSRNKYRRSVSSMHNSEPNDSSDTGMDQVNADDFFLQNIPHISMVESKFDINSLKRDGDHHGPGASLRNSLGGTGFNFDYMFKNNGGSNSGQEYPNELHMANDYSKNFGNHMDIPPNSSNVVMLSSTSLLHGNCVFNRNNTVATQQGMKTYWLCKSYRISMCRARCITHQGRVISATGVHNHPPHMRGGAMAPSANNSSTGYSGENSQLNPQTTNTSASNMTNTNVTPTQMQGGSNMFQQHNLHSSSHELLPPPPSGNIMPPSSHAHHLSQTLPNLLIQHHSSGSHHSHSLGSNGSQALQTQNSVIQNMMHNANIMPPLSSMPSLLTSHGNPQNSPHLSEHSTQPQSNLELTPIVQSSPANMQSPSNRSNQSLHGGNSIDSPITLKSPAQNNMNDDAPHMSDRHIMVHNAALSPSELSSNANLSSNSRANDGHHHAHVIDSITISPGHTHNFKMEDI
ncbi:hybrid signal transduction histidine kinase A isoform X2 [Teleopsis dalmanni]|uniref:hybrid signal transduction histidine kinase A isoform X2 n=1 Tax=Teleopsis dalmanni TaxID=139649 RepID=UPI0018CCBCFA|nr:hybrid signal transduction histidine kinase A isoform X2 [Teleopsis dalmanni]